MRRWIIGISLCLLVNRPAHAYTTGFHFDLTEAALTDPSIATVMGASFSPQAIGYVKLNNFFTDWFWADPLRSSDITTPALKLHFDNLLTPSAVKARWDLYERETRQRVQTEMAKRSPDPRVILQILGLTLHGVQDFYTHSSWVKLPWGTEQIPTWFEAKEIERSDRQRYDLMTRNLYTGLVDDGLLKAAMAAKKDGVMVPPCHYEDGHRNPKGFTIVADDTHDGSPAGYGEHKDWAGRFFHEESMVVGARAGVEWVKMVRSWAIGSGGDSAMREWWWRNEIMAPRDNWVDCAQLTHDLNYAYLISMRSGQWHDTSDADLIGLSLNAVVFKSEPFVDATAYGQWRDGTAFKWLTDPMGNQL